MSEHRTFVRGIGMLVLLGIGVVIAFSSTSCIGTGHVGVVTMFGRVTGQTLSEGIHIINPVANVTELNIKASRGRLAVRGTASVCRSPFRG